MTTPVIVTGGSSGIGRAVVRRLSSRGHPVVIAYRNGEPSARELVAELEVRGGRAVAVRANVAERADVRALFDAAEREFGTAAGLVNNAGVSAVKPIAETGDALIEELLGVNLRGSLYGMQEAAARLADGGSIVNISSTAVATATPGLGVYLAAKAGVETLTRVAAKEFGARGIRVNAVAPGLVDSPMFRDGKTAADIDRCTAQAPLHRLGDFDEIAAAVGYLLGPDASWVNGQVLRVNGGVG
ncbi:MAG: dehydrogenase, short-chain alcohol dehydrogenase like protein [Nocardia sp.]|uniref:SDR family oxidoreductase n=1 Tax=Nocardia sp. TaxID=1821 RepID=UPI00261286FA|nr:SDR family oxidoreductase [Nocardia sp.]MCU1647243.1 dehydrogenase, short-chain alcohol dehydrogenase like protein [Nocardia sp.]